MKQEPKKFERNVGDNDPFSTKKHLLHRLNQMTIFANELKDRLSYEKALLEKEKMETMVLHSYLSRANLIHSTYSMPSNFYMDGMQRNSKPIASQSQIQKKHFLEIQQKCDAELANLKTYIKTLNQVKQCWAENQKDFEQTEKFIEQEKKMHDNLVNGTMSNNTGLGNHSKKNHMEFLGPLDEFQVLHGQNGGSGSGCGQN